MKLIMEKLMQKNNLQQLVVVKSKEDGENPSSLLFVSPECVCAGSNSAINNLIRIKIF